MKNVEKCERNAVKKRSKFPFFHAQLTATHREYNFDFCFALKLN